MDSSNHLPDGIPTLPRHPLRGGQPTRHETALVAALFAGVAVGGIVLIVWNLLRDPRRLGAWPDDWDFFFQAYEAIRISIVHYGQFPWWNIWSCGGLPLFANPQVGVLSVHTPFVLLFGTVLGLKLSVVAHVLLGFEGARRLLRRYASGPFALFGALLFIACGGLAMHITAGHFNTTVIYFFPWLLHFALSLGRRPLYGWLFGVGMALMVLETIDYFAVFQAAILSVAALCVLVTYAGRRWRVAQGIAIAFGVFLLIAGFRLGLSTWYVRQYSVTASEPVATLRGDMAAVFLSPITDLLHQRPGAIRPWWEYGCYIGLPVVALFCISLFRGPRYWHFGAALCLLAGCSLVDAWSPSYWLSKVPVFKAMRVLARWRIPTAFFIIMGAAVEADTLWRRAGRRWARLAMVGVCVVAMVAVVGVSRRITQQIFRGVRAERTPQWSQHADGFFHLEPQENESRRFRPMFPATRVNRGVVEGYEPLLGYDRVRANAVQSRGEVGYVGEAAANGRPVEPASWSPNRIIFEDVPGPLRVNLAPGSYWRVNDKAVFSAMRVAELTEPFIAEPDPSGRIVLSIVPSGWHLGVAISFLGVPVLLVTGVASLLARRSASALPASEARAGRQERARVTPAAE